MPADQVGSEPIDPDAAGPLPEGRVAVWMAMARSPWGPFGGR